jgi:hypothetical protein
MNNQDRNCLERLAREFGGLQTLVEQHIKQGEMTRKEIKIELKELTKITLVEEYMRRAEPFRKEIKAELKELSMMIRGNDKVGLFTRIDRLENWRSGVQGKLARWLPVLFAGGLALFTAWKWGGG